MVGLDMLLNRNSAAYATPTWVEVKNVRDLSGPDSMGEADASSRRVKVKQFEPTLEEIAFEWEMIYDPADADFVAFQTAYRTRAKVDLAFSDGPMATSGTNYFRIECKIFGFERSETLEGMATRKVTAKPCYSANAPVATTVP
jgi:hypothetical protein